jgi:hypothetical protein
MKEFELWWESGWRTHDTPRVCPPWPEIARFIERKGKAAIPPLEALAAARAYTGTWQADKDASPLKVKPMWRLADVAICGGRHGSIEVVKIRIDRAHQLPSGAWCEKHERYPHSERWGTDGFTYTSNSHSNPEAAAFGRAILFCCHLEKEDEQ